MGKELKKCVGKTIWLLPGGNAVTRGSLAENQVFEAELVSCARIRATFRTLDGSHTTEFDISGRYDKYNYKYLPFVTKQSLLDYLEAEVFMSRLRYGDIPDMTVDKVLQIKALIDG